MAIATYIAANAPNDNDHMSKLQALALEGVRVLQTVRKDKPTCDPTPRGHTGATQQHRNQPTAPAVAPRPHIVQPINGKLRHSLAQNRVDSARTQHEARRFIDTHGRGIQTILGINNDELCGVECFNLYIRTTPLPKGLKISEGTIKFNGQHDPRIWLDDFLTTVMVSYDTKDNAMQLLQLYLRDAKRA
jgi:hypothetical protein